MGNIRFGKIVDSKSPGNDLAMRICVRIAAFICSIPPFITILIFIIQNKKIPMTLQRKIQIMMCISFLGLEASFFFPPITEEDIILCSIQGTISFSFFVINCCWQFIHSYIAYKLFLEPIALSKCLYKFLLLCFPWIVLLILGLYIFFFSDLRIFYGLMVFPNDIISKFISNVSIFSFFIANICATIELLFKIKQTLNPVNNTSFNTKKYYTYRKKLLSYILGMIITYHACIIMGVAKIICGEEPAWIYSFPFSLHYYLIEAASGLIYWYIYVCNAKLWKRFLIMIHLSNEEEKNNIESKNYNENNESNSASIDLTASNNSKTNIQLKDLSYSQNFLGQSDTRNNIGINNTNYIFDDDEEL